MKFQIGLLVSAFCFGIALPLALGHKTGHESRVVADCDRLPLPERQVCGKCVTRPLKHHYHPDYPPGARCRPDNGKP